MWAVPRFLGGCCCRCRCRGTLGAQWCGQRLRSLGRGCCRRDSLSAAAQAARSALIPWGLIRRLLYNGRSSAGSASIPWGPVLSPWRTGRSRAGNASALGWTKPIPPWNIGRSCMSSAPNLGGWCSCGCRGTLSAAVRATPSATPQSSGGRSCYRRGTLGAVVRAATDLLGVVRPGLVLLPWKLGGRTCSALIPWGAGAAAAVAQGALVVRAALRSLGGLVLMRRPWHLGCGHGGSTSLLDGPGVPQTPGGSKWRRGRK
jgi:hypothetical protein